MRRYKVTTIIEVLDDPDKWTNPESGKVESHVRSIQDGERSYNETVEPPWREVARFGTGEGVDADTFIEAMPMLNDKITETYTEVTKFASFVDQDTPPEQGR